MLFRHPFFSIIALHLPEVEDEHLESAAATDGKKVIINPKILLDPTKFPKETHDFVCMHEVLHVVGGHCWPWRVGARDKKLWNLAADYVVNLMLMELNDNRMTEPAKRHLIDKKVICYDEKFKDMSVEEVYDILSKDPKAQQMANNMQMADLLYGGVGKDGVTSDRERSEIEEQWRDIITRAKQAQEQSKGRGNLPAGLKRLLDEIIDPVVPWYRILDTYLTDLVRDDYAAGIYDRRYIQQYGIYLPDIFQNGGDVVVAVDTSGSIGQDQIRAFVAEISGIVRTKGVQKVRIMSWDTQIHMDETVHPWDDLPDNYPGGGGSDCACVFDRLEEEMTAPSVLILLTDLDIGFPKEAPHYPVIFATDQKSKTESDIPFGQFLYWDAEIHSGLGMASLLSDA